MRIVIDTNMIIASLIMDGTSRKILFNNKFEFVSPSYNLTEILKYEKEIMHKAHVTHEEFKVLISLIFEKIEIIPKSAYGGFIEEAKDLIKDTKDVSFIALCLALNADGIWSNDSHFFSQKRIKVFTTKDMISLAKD